MADRDLAGLGVPAGSEGHTAPMMWLRYAASRLRIPLLVTLGLLVIAAIVVIGIGPTHHGGPDSEG